MPKWRGDLPDALRDAMDEGLNRHNNALQSTHVTDEEEGGSCAVPVHLVKYVEGRWTSEQVRWVQERMDDTDRCRVSSGAGWNAYCI